MRHDGPGRHPDQDLLADLAAEVLPENEARVVEAHVIGCARCADLLADAERVRRLLLSDDPGPMPDAVWSRIEHALGAEVDARTAAARNGEVGAPAAWNGAQDWFTQEWPAAADLPADLAPGWTPEGAFDPSAPEPLSGQAIEQAAGAVDLPPDAPTAQWTQFVAEGNADFGAVPDRAVPDRAAVSDRAVPDRAVPDRAAVSDLAAVSDGTSADGTLPGSAEPGSPSRAGRLAGRPSLRSARSLRTRREVRADTRPSPLTRYGRPLAIAAGVIVVAGLGVYAVTIMPGGGDSTSTTAFSAASGESAGEAPVAAAATGAGGAAAGGGPAVNSGAGYLATVGGTPVLATGTKYTAADLAAVALALPGVTTQADAATRGSALSAPAGGGGTAPSASAAAAGSATSAAASAATAAAAVSPGPTAAATVPKVPANAGNRTLLDPAKLSQCIAALNLGTVRLLAVDLATYAGQDAAILVLTGRDGGYEVWVVRRDCGTSDAGAITYKLIPAK